jgi:undecaprenyl-diphosphatase
LSFPSGHALGVTVGVLSLLTVLLPVVRSRWRTALVVGGAVAVLAIGVGRVALNVHYPSDVVAGWALGYLYYLLCLATVRPSPLTEITSGGETRAVSDTEP